jgi:hypothetical protein
MFKDSDELTEVRWYKVPKDRPFLPIASFVQNEWWRDENGPRGGMEHGNVVGQGPDLGPWPFSRKGPSSRAIFTGHYCGTPEQWGGDLLRNRSADIGDLDCCGYVSPLLGSGTDSSTGGLVGSAAANLTNGLVGSGTDAGLGPLIGSGTESETDALVSSGSDTAPGGLIGSGSEQESALLGSGTDARTGRLLGSGQDAMPGNLASGGTEAEAGSLVGDGQRVSPGEGCVYIRDVDPGTALLSGSTREETDNILVGSGTEADTGSLTGSGTGSAVGVLVGSGMASETGTLVGSGADSPGLTAPCQDVDLSAAVGTVFNKVGACTCVNNPMHRVSGGYDMAVWSTQGSCEGNFNLTLSCVSGQYSLTSTSSTAIITLTSFQAFPLEIIYHIEGVDLCGTGFGSFDFKITDH